MKSINKNRNGFSAIETILVLVIIAAIASVGWFVWHSKQAADKTLAPINSSSPTFKKIQKTKQATTQSANLYDGWQSYSNSHVSYKYPKGWTAALGPDKVSAIDDMATSSAFTSSAVTTTQNPGAPVTLMLQLDTDSSTIDCDIDPCQVSAVTALNNPQLPDTVLAVVNQTSGNGTNYSEYVVASDSTKVGDTAIQAAKAGSSDIYLWGQADYTAKDGTVGDAARISDTTSFQADSHFKDLINLINSIHFN